VTTVDDVCLDVLDATEFVAIVTNGEDGPHVVGNWGEYIRKLSPNAETIVMPAGGYHRTEKNLARDNRIKLLIASRRLRGSHGPGQGCVVSGTAELVTEGSIVEEVKSHFPWARGALVVSVEEIVPQL
jgi:pyridoxamine 5'-phosphate oxidase-like protein